MWCPPSGSRDMAAALEAAGSAVYIYTEYPGVDHDCWTLAYSEPNLLGWLFSQSKSGVATTDSKSDMKVDIWQIAGYAVAAVILTAAGIAVYGSIRARKNGGSSDKPD